MKKIILSIAVLAGCALAVDCEICEGYEKQIDKAIEGVNSVVDSAVALTGSADKTARDAYRKMANARYTEVIIEQLRSAESVCPKLKAKADSLASVYVK